MPASGVKLCAWIDDVYVVDSNFSNELTDLSITGSISVSYKDSQTVTLRNVLKKKFNMILHKNLFLLRRTLPF